MAGNWTTQAKADGLENGTMKTLPCECAEALDDNARFEPFL